MRYAIASRKGVHIYIQKYFWRPETALIFTGERYVFVELFRISVNYVTAGNFNARMNPSSCFKEKSEYT